MERRLPFSSSVGTALSLCLLWGFVACVLMCMYHGEDAHDAVTVEVLDNGCGADGCPMTDDTEFVTPGRPSNVPRTGEAWRSCPAAPRAPEGVYAAAPPAELEATPTPSHGPPRKKLCVLRI